MNVSKKARLRKAWQRVATVPGLGRNVGALAVVIVLGLLAAGYLLGNLGVRMPWGSSEQFKMEFDDAVAVSPGNGQDLRIAGVRVGQIEAAEPTDHNTSVVTVSVEPGHTIYQNAHAVLRPKNPLNEMYIELQPGGPPAQPLPPDGTLLATQTERPVQVEEVLNHLDARSRNAMTELISQSDVALANAKTDLPNGLNATNSTLTKLRPVLESLQTRRESLAKLVTAFSQLSTAVGHNDRRLTSLVNSLQQTLGVLSHRGGNLEKTLEQLPGVTDQLHSSMTKTSTLTKELNPTLDNVNKAADTLPDALSRLSSTVDEVGNTVQAGRVPVSKLRPVIGDLRPVVGDLGTTLNTAKPVTATLDEVTAKVAPWMDDLAAFVYNTASVFSPRDASGNLPRGHLTVDLRAPLGGSRVHPSSSYRDTPSPLGPYPEIGSGGQK